MNKLVAIFFLLYFSNAVLSQPLFTEEDKEICSSKFQFAVDNKLQEKPINEIILEIGKSFIGTSYKAHTLEREGDERLIINLTEFDCTTFLENVLAITRCVKYDKTTFEEFQNELTKIRYREGVIDKYPSRLHYFTDWIYNNSKKGILEDITKSIGGIVCPNKVGFMTRNRKKYEQISNNDDFYKLIRKQEKEINSRKFYFIPKKKVKLIEEKIGEGDLIAITSGIKFLDVLHVGIAVKMQNGRIHLLHAPSPGSKVHITEKPLHEYLARNKNQTGIVVLKPIEPIKFVE